MDTSTNIILDYVILCYNIEGMTIHADKEVGIMAKESTTSNLPARTTVENMFKLLDAFKRKSGNEEEAKSIFGMGTSAFASTKSVLRTFGFIDEDSCALTTGRGRVIAYSQDADKKEELKKIVVKFFPYESLVTNIFQKGNVEETIVEDITSYWGRFGHGSTPGNLESAATLFMDIMGYLGFGKYVIGRRKRPTRIEWVENAKQMFEEIMNDSNESEHSDESEKIPTELQAQLVEKEDIAEPAYSKPLRDSQQYTFKPMPNIVINVDMSAWSEEKIKSFFKYAYGLFEEDCVANDEHSSEP
jgi:hypothetical protein